MTASATAGDMLFDVLTEHYYRETQTYPQGEGLDDWYGCSCACTTYVTPPFQFLWQAVQNMNVHLIAQFNARAAAQVPS